MGFGQDMNRDIMDVACVGAGVGGNDGIQIEIVLVSTRAIGQQAS